LWPDNFSFVPRREDDLAVVLAEDRCRVNIGGESLRADARITFRPHRFPSAQVELATLDLNVFEEEPVSLELELSGFALQDGLLSVIPQEKRSAPSRFAYRVRQTEPMIFTKPGDIIEVDALVYNLSRFSLAGGPSNGREQLTLDIPGGWKVTIGPLEPKLRQNRETVKLLGSPWRRPTNSLHFTRPGGSSAAPDEVQGLIFLFQYFLSFAWGRFIGIGLGQGFSSTGVLSYIMPGLTHIDPQTHPVAQRVHWFPPSQAEILLDILPTFWRKMTDPSWKEPIEWGIYWWLSANHSLQVSETSILASQAGLESVALAFLCNLGRLRKKDLKNMSASEKIGRMLDLMRVPRAIPGQLDELRSLATRKGWDGPQSLTKVRNALVHPSKGSETGLAFEASQLGMWYLELTLLFLFEYRGRMVNRTVFRSPWWEQELVPWT
jgi:hypothetical protein